MDLSHLADAIQHGRMRITDHADEEAANDELTLDDVLFSTQRGEIIEDYPDDKPYPSCLVLGFCRDGKPLHSVWAYNEANRWAVLVTVYRPDPNRWAQWRRRKPRS